MSIFRVISYIIIYIVFITLGMYLESSAILMTIFPTILTISLIISSYLGNRGYAEKCVISSIKFLTYLYISSLVFMFVFISGDGLIINLISGGIGSVTIVGYLIAISHTGRDRHEIRR